MKTKRKKPAVSRKKKKTTRVTVDFPVAQHRELKARAALEGVTLQEYIRSKVALAMDVSDEELDPIVQNLIEEHGDILKRLANQ